MVSNNVCLNNIFPVSLNPIQGGCKFAHPYLDVTKRKINFLTFDIIILDIFCESLACVGPPLQILMPFSEEDPQMLWSVPCKIAKLVNIL